MITDELLAKKVIADAKAVVLICRMDRSPR